MHIRRNILTAPPRREHTPRLHVAPEVPRADAAESTAERTPTALPLSCEGAMLCAWEITWDYLLGDESGFTSRAADFPPRDIVRLVAELGLQRDVAAASQGRRLLGLISVGVGERRVLDRVIEELSAYAIEVAEGPEIVALPFDRAWVPREEHVMRLFGLVDRVAAMREWIEHGTD